MCGIDNDVENYLLERAGDDRNLGQALVKTTQIHRGDVLPLVARYGDSGRDDLAEVLRRLVAGSGMSKRLQRLHDAGYLPYSFQALIERRRDFFGEEFDVGVLGDLLIGLY